MAKTRKDYEGNIRQRPDGRWEVRVTLGNDFATGESKRISRYASSRDEAVKLLHELSFLRDTVPYLAITFVNIGMHTELLNQ